MATSGRTASVAADGRSTWFARLAADIQLDRVVVISFVASRLIVLAAALAAELALPHGRSLEPGDEAPILASLTSWDGWWYLGIARDGYHAEPLQGLYHDTAFAPLYPLLIRVLAAPWPAFAGLTAVVVSNVLFLIGLGVLTTLGSIHLGRDRAVRAAALLAFYPFSVVFAMAYTESLFLLLMVGAFLAAERRQRAAAGVLLALATATRVQGIVLLLPLAILMLRQDGWRPRWSLGWLLLGPVALGGFFLLVASVTGSPTGYFDSLRDWAKGGIGSAPAAQTLAAALSLEQAALLAALLFSIYLLVFARVDRIRLEYVLVPVVFVAASISSGTLESVGRYTMMAFPLVWILAGRTSWFGRVGWPVISVVLFGLISALTFAQYWVP